MEPEREIEKLCHEIDAARARGDAAGVTRIEARVAELVKLTGPRKATGIAELKIPLQR